MLRILFTLAFMGVRVHAAEGGEGGGEGGAPKEKKSRFGFGNKKPDDLQGSSQTKINGGPNTGGAWGALKSLRSGLLYGKKMKSADKLDDASANNDGDGGRPTIEDYLANGNPGWDQSALPSHERYAYVGWLSPRYWLYGYAYAPWRGPKTTGFGARYLIMSRQTQETAFEKMTYARFKDYKMQAESNGGRTWNRVECPEKGRQLPRKGVMGKMVKVWVGAGLYEHPRAQMWSFARKAGYAFLGFFIGVRFIDGRMTLKENLKEMQDSVKDMWNYVFGGGSTKGEFASRFFGVDNNWNSRRVNDNDFYSR